LNEREPDSDLAGKALGGDLDAFVTLCERHRTRVWRVVVSIARGPDADDLAQEAIVRAYCALSTYRAEAPFEAWLCRIALHVAHDYQRSAWRRRVTLWQRAPEVDPGRTESPEAEVARREMQRRVRQAVAALPPNQRAPIWLHYFEEFSLAEVARLERVPESTIRSRVQAGLKRLSGSLRDLPAGSSETSVCLGADAIGADAKGCGA
jgi:RNA polymerase sigma-70 factor (ECF subfamily)